MLYAYSREEISRMANSITNGRTYSEAIDELYPKSEYQCIYECALENMQSFSLLNIIYNALTKRKQPEFQASCTKCLTCAEC